MVKIVMMLLKKTLQVLLFCLVLSSINTNAQTSVDIQKYETAAKKGVVSAQDSLGHFYYVGRGVNQSFPDAVKWWQKAAKQGDSYAQFWLGRCLYDGKGVALGPAIRAVFSPLAPLISFSSGK